MAGVELQCRTLRRLPFGLRDRFRWDLRVKNPLFFRLLDRSRACVPGRNLLATFDARAAQFGYDGRQSLQDNHAHKLGGSVMK